MIKKKENEYFIFDNIEQKSIKNTAKTIVYKMLKIKYRFELSRNCNEGKKKKYNVSICAIFKNEAFYLKEWIEYHRIVGIDHFYMYNNNSEDEFIKVLTPYINKGIVTLVDWPYNQAQIKSYKDCITRFNEETQWLGFIDIDEFIVPKVTDNIYSFLKPFEKNRGSVIIYWKLFGTSGLMSRDLKGLVTEDFTVCWPKYCDIGKSFYNTSFPYNGDSKRNTVLHHKFWASLKGKDLPPVNVFNKICVGNQNIATSKDFPIQINHYFTKSYEEYAMKKNKGDVFFIDNPHDEEYFYEHESKCSDVDFSIYKYLIKLKIKMKGDKNEEL